MNNLITHNGIIKKNSEGILEIEPYSSTISELFGNKKISVSASVYNDFEFLDKIFNTYSELKLNSKLLNLENNSTTFILDKNSLRINKKIDQDGYERICTKLKDEFTPRLKPNKNIENVLEVLLNYKCDIDIQNYLAMNEMETDEFEWYNIEGYLSKLLDITINEYFKTINECVANFVKEQIKISKKVLVVTPFTNNKYIQTYCSNEKIEYVNELDFETIESVQNNAKLKSDFVLKTAKASLNAGWIVLNQETQILPLINCQKLTDVSISKVLEGTKRLTYNKINTSKYYFELYKNHFNINCLKIKAIDNKIYYKEI
jgi:hypothetical protein